jgi:cytoskeleton protein RodZ
MSDDVDNQQTEETAGETEGPVAGERLAEARREQQISVVEIAKELHLDELKVRALERNEFDILGAPVFAKGHLKKYAQLVGVDPDDVLTDYYQLTRSLETTPVISVRTRPRQELTPGPWIAVIVVIIIAVTAYWWFTSRPLTEEPDAQQEASLSGDQESTPEVVVLPEAEETASDEPAAAAEAVEETPEPAVADTPEPVAEASPEPVVEASPQTVEEGQLLLLVTYSGDCWTEITDASGRRLLFALGKDGRTVELSGTEPFNVLLGNPGNVSLQVNGEEYALPPTNRPDRPMRLTISGS